MNSTRRAGLLQRGVLGTLFLLLACGVIFLAVFAYVTIAYES